MLPLQSGGSRQRGAEILEGPSFPETGTAGDVACLACDAERANQATKTNNCALPSACGLIQSGTFGHICCTNKKCQSCYLHKMNFSKSHKAGPIHGSFLNSAPNLFP